MVRKLIKQPSDQEVSAELESMINEDDEETGKHPLPCWKRARQCLPRLHIEVGYTNYLLPWYAVTSVEANKEFTSVQINTSLGMLFKIDSEYPQEELFKYLQIEMVKMVSDNGTGIKIRIIEKD